MNPLLLTDLFYAIAISNNTSLPHQYPELMALAQVESGDRDYVIGKKGEVSCYQILPSTWKQYACGKYSVHYWSRKQWSAQVALRHSMWLGKEFSQESGYNKAPNSLEFYCLWNLGLEGFRKYSFSVQAVPSRTRNAAQRYQNLVYLYYSKN